MNDKGNDDLASLFLPDLLHPLANTDDIIKQEDEFGPALFLDRRSDVLTPPLLGLFAQYEQPEMPFHFNQNIRRYLPFGEENGRTLHYADFVPLEAAGHLPKQHQQLYMQMMQVQPAFLPLTVIGQFEGFNPWIPNMPGAPVPVERFERERLEAHTHIPIAKMDPPPVEKPKIKRELNLPHIDYKQVNILPLMDLKPGGRKEAVYDRSGREVAVGFRGFLNGRFFTNEQDNYNYMLVSAGTPTLQQQAMPQMMSCYRRNFIQVNVNLQVDTAELMLNGEPFLKFRIEVGASTNRDDGDDVPIIIGVEKAKDVREVPRSDADCNPIRLNELSHTVDLVGPTDGYYSVKKVQYKSATANSLNLTFQTYFQLTVKLIAVLPSRDVVVRELVSSPTIVRGRNPSFYQERQDVLIKGRSACSTMSYRLSGQDSQANTATLSSDPEVKAELNSQEPDEEANDDDGEEVEAEEDEEGKDKKLPPGSAINLKSLLDPESFIKDGKRTHYRYFPILNVYYLPPINVVYFPHRAHQFKQPSMPSPAPQDSKASTPSTGGTERKRTSKVYFK